MITWSRPFVRDAVLAALFWLPVDRRDRIERWVAVGRKPDGSATRTVSSSPAAIAGAPGFGSCSPRLPASGKIGGYQRLQRAADHHRLRQHAHRRPDDAEDKLTDPPSPYLTLRAA